MPVLTVIAGPNGAGKSSHSKELLEEWNIEAFDFDKVFYGFWSDLGFDPAIEEGSYDRALNLYEQLKAEALNNGGDFAFESNYHTPKILATLEQFRLKGYILRLVFIFLDRVEIARERVDNRFLKGGHWVDYDTIQYRFDHGLILLDQSFDTYDEVHLFQSVDNGVEGVSILKPPLGQVVRVVPIPLNLQPRLPRLKEFIDKHSW